ncbi:hypothetical protein [Pseudoalteromonas fuliginea]|uniref:O-antigen ligase domain-containing protein n=1 Tax=Pseudoalteromonas fuliginea TaxID=1872678 RepID=A0ABQ6RNE0_9GAMM|nr:hypothetical protein [Pseudoalteromonas fuliginea]KAA1166113.1 hypothetical protein EU509_00670 [Pseudoalteromonas fuliginea]KAA1169755.1 hypothetical protein EUZ79_00780 [Pseudoalteromonas fuliginea]
MVNKYTPLALLIAFLSLSDYMSLIFSEMDIPDFAIFPVFFILSFISFVYYNSSKISLPQVYYILFVSFYFILISILNFEDLRLEGFSVFFSFFTATFIYLVLNERSFTELFYLLLMSLFFYLLGALSFELVNKVLGGNNLIIIFQNNLPYLFVITFLLYSLRKSIGYGKGISTLNYCFFLLFIYILFSLFEYGNYRIQFKIIFLMSFLSILIFFEKIIINNFYFFKLSLLLFALISIPFFWLIQEQLEFFVNASGRLGSGMMRIEVFNAIIIKLQTFSQMLIGSGLGASSIEFEVIHNNIMYELRSHSGFASIMLDFGLLGLVTFFWIPCLLLLYRLRASPKVFLYGFLISFCWIFLNTVYLSAIPTANIYNFSMLSLVLVSISLFTKFKTVK